MRQRAGRGLLQSTIDSIPIDRIAAFKAGIRAAPGTVGTTSWEGLTCVGPSRTNREKEVPHGDATVATDPGRAGRVLRRMGRRGELESDTPDTEEAGG